MGAYVISVAEAEYLAMQIVVVMKAVAPVMITAMGVLYACVMIIGFVKWLCREE